MIGVSGQGRSPKKQGRKGVRPWVSVEYTMVDRHAQESGSGYRTLAREAKVVRWDEWKFFMQL